LGAICAVATAGDPGEIVLSGKQRTISPISRRPSFTIFERNTSIGMTVKTFGTEFEKFHHNGSFFEINKNFSKVFNVLRLQAAIIPQ